jgi:hypothetical protein
LARIAEVAAHRFKVQRTRRQIEVPQRQIDWTVPPNPL